MAIDENSKPTGTCGDEVSISAAKTLAMSKADLTGISAGTDNASIQCWGDAELGDATQDYDYNDFTIIFGYATSSDVGACTYVNIHKNVGEVKGTVPLTAEQLMSLKVGDLLSFYLKPSMTNLNGRFRVTINNVPGEWITANYNSAENGFYYHDYVVSAAGTYKFEGQVTTTAQ